MNQKSESILLDEPLWNKAYSTWYEHIPFAFFLVEQLKPRIFVELGVYNGVSYFAFCQAVKRLNLKTKCYGIDSWQGDKHSGFCEERIRLEVFDHNKKEYGNFSSLLTLFFDDALKEFEEKNIDILHIDGFHTYESVKHDFESWLPKMSDKGVILFHDTIVKENNFGVWKLWKEIENKYPSFNFKHNYGLGVLAVGKNVPPLFLKELKKLRDKKFQQQLFAKIGKSVMNERIVKSHQEEILKRDQDLLEKEIIKKELKSIQNSYSWKITAPIRNLLDFFKKVKHKDNNNISEITPLKMTKSHIERKRINLVIPSINNDKLFGGVSTALSFFEQIIEKTKEEYDFRIILTDSVPNKKDLVQFKQYCLVDSYEDKEEKFQIISVCSYNRNIPVRKDDYFIATSWWTAYIIQNLVKDQSKLFDITIKTIIYFIQDFEPLFYLNNSNKYLLAEGTYNYNGNQIAVFNTSLLKEYFKDKGYFFTKEFSFEPLLNPVLLDYLKNISVFNKKKQILIYGRPSTPRNAFRTIVESLRIWRLKYEDYKEWKIYSVGEKHKDINLGGILIHSLGKLSLEDYAKILEDSAIGISLMISPHPSYPPLEMASFKVLTITNAFENKNLSKWGEYIRSIDSCTVLELSEKVSETCREYESRKNILKNINKDSYVNSTSQFPFIKEIINYLEKS